ncbi:nitroreductase/quinone reductase family protein [Nocardioides sp. REDSEA-S30_B4]|jgi:deazaflavin-dependent oxidoreductase (nitroreductase family)|uniref:nitroreductase/quinone reductase family protein n=1 Tax=Nocardioides sp. REDSEA-S30_B4 TaxID=1811552 RepID=UPI000A6F2F1D|nr:nitroreductase/quinone reductase family protein [Nocardioides sp. REDSEA-S30_B4]
MGLPEERPPGLDNPRTVTAIKWMAKIQVAVFKATNGRVGRYWRIGAGWRKPVPTLLLHHVGRKSGTAFTTPLLYLPYGDGPDADLVIVASQGGLPKNPQWFHNLMAAPDCEVSLPGRRRVPVHAHRADSAEKERLWPLLVDLYADFAKYAVWTDRDIPVVVLSPR